MVNQEFKSKTMELIDNLKAVCATYGLGNDGNEFKIITQVFLYKFMNDKFGYEVKKIDSKLKDSNNWEDTISSYSENEYEMLLLQLPPDSARLKPEHFISNLFNKQNQEEFHKLFDDTLREIAILNNDIFSVKTGSGAKIKLFDELSQYITDSSDRDNFCKALIDKLVNFSFEGIFDQKFDFFATIFEYLIKDYNKDGGGKYAEYYTPHAVAKIMASILVDEPVSNVTCYDPSAGSGQLLMNLAHAIGEDKCTIYSQDISQKSSGMLRLNLILNNLVHSIQNIIKGDTLLSPYHKVGDEIMKFDFIVSNPPFKLDFSDTRDDLDTRRNSERFFAGIPNIPNKNTDEMEIYLLFLQHILLSLNVKGRAAVVVPTGFLTAPGNIPLSIRKRLIDKNILKGVICMPSNIFATTTTNVSVLIIEKQRSNDTVTLVDASKLGNKSKNGRNQKTILSENDEKSILDAFSDHKQKGKKGFSVKISNQTIRDRGYSLSPGHYFNTQIQFSRLSSNIFEEEMHFLKEESKNLFTLNANLQRMIELIFSYWFLQFDFPDHRGRPYKSNGGKMVFNEKVGKELPLGWEVADLGSILYTTLGGTPDTKISDYWEGGDIPWLSSGELDSLPISKSDKTISKSGLSNSAAELLPIGTIVVSIVRYIRVSILGIDAATNQSVVGIKEDNTWKKNYIYPYLLSMVPVLMSRRTGAQQPHINKREIDSINFVMPKKEIISKYYEITDPIFKSLTDNRLSVTDLDLIFSNLETIHDKKN